MNKLKKTVEPDHIDWESLETLTAGLRSWRSSPGFLAYILGHPPSDAEISQFGMKVCSSKPKFV
jgi:hypothetical protein